MSAKVVVFVIIAGKNQSLAFRRPTAQFKEFQFIYVWALLMRGNVCKLARADAHMQIVDVRAY